VHRPADRNHALMSPGSSGELRTRPGRHGGNVLVPDSGTGLANATLQQRLSVPARLFYDFLVEEGVR